MPYSTKKRDRAAPAAVAADDNSLTSDRTRPLPQRSACGASVATASAVRLPVTRNAPAGQRPEAPAHIGHFDTGVQTPCALYPESTASGEYCRQITRHRARKDPVRSYRSIYSDPLTQDLNQIGVI